MYNKFIRIDVIYCRKKESQHTRKRDASRDVFFFLVSFSVISLSFSLCSRKEKRHGWNRRTDGDERRMAYSKTKYRASFSLFVVCFGFGFDPV